MPIDQKLVSDIIAKRRNSSSEADIIRQENSKQIRNALSSSRQQKKTELDIQNAKTALEDIDRLKKAKEAEELKAKEAEKEIKKTCLLYTSPSPRDRQKSRMPSSA